ncbi:hypothetical protein LCGC14_0938120 [marine sediment metagenome]|uniref:Uncharacterized protein n=1 Tax=marine sediment metagenome TaxID=412755 RepID=A0A0F9R4G6_9ZZZZ
MKCTMCNGTKKLDDGNYAYMTYHNRFTKCGLCKGKGWITRKQAMRYAQEFIKEEEKR